jgi:predicted XRE-type DNA-binding protein
LERRILTKGWTQAEAARQLGVIQPRISDLKRGKIDLEIREAA